MALYIAVCAATFAGDATAQSQNVSPTNASDTGDLADHYRQMFPDGEATVGGTAAATRRILDGWSSLGFRFDDLQIGFEDGTGVDGRKLRQIVAATNKQKPESDAGLVLAAFGSPDASITKLRAAVRQISQNAQHRAIAALAQDLTETFKAHARKGSAANLADIYSRRERHVTPLAVIFGPLPGTIADALRSKLAGGIDLDVKRTSPSEIHLATLRRDLLLGFDDAASDRKYAPPAATLPDRLKEAISRHLARVIEAPDLDAYVRDMGRSPMQRDRLVTVDGAAAGRRRLMWSDRPWLADEVLHQLKIWQALAIALEWPEGPMIDKLVRYLQGDGDAEALERAIILLNRMAEATAERPATPIATSVAAGGQTSRLLESTGTFLPDGELLGLIFFKSLLKGGEAATTTPPFQVTDLAPERLAETLAPWFVGDADGASMRALAAAAALTESRDLTGLVSAVHNEIGRPGTVARSALALRSAAALSRGPLEKAELEALYTALVKDLALTANPGFAARLFEGDGPIAAPSLDDIPVEGSPLVAFLVAAGNWSEVQSTAVSRLVSVPIEGNGDAGRAASGNTKICAAEFADTDRLVTAKARQSLLWLAENDKPIAAQDSNTVLRLAAETDRLLSAKKSSPAARYLSRNRAVLSALDQLRRNQTDTEHRAASGAARLSKYISGRLHDRLTSELVCPVLAAALSKAEQIVTYRRLSRADAKGIKSLEIVDKRLRLLEADLWSRIAPSSRPFGADSYDPERHIPIYNSFVKRTLAGRKALLLAAVGGDASSGSATDANNVLDTILQDAERFERAFEWHIRQIDKTIATVARLSTLSDATAGNGTRFSIAPVHMTINPADFVADDRGDSTWSATYMSAATMVARDLVAANEADGDRLARFHPFFDVLLRIKLQSLKLGLMDTNAGAVSEDELIEVSKRLLIGPALAPISELPLSVNPVATILNGLKVQTAVDYAEFLKRANRLFDLNTDRETTNRLEVSTPINIALALKVRGKVGRLGAPARRALRHLQWRVERLSDVAEAPCQLDAASHGHTVNAQGVETEKSLRLRQQLFIRQAGTYQLTATATGPGGVSLAKLTKPLMLVVEPASLEVEIAAEGGQPALEGLGVMLAVARRARLPAVPVAPVEKLGKLRTTLCALPAVGDVVWRQPGDAKEGQTESEALPLEVFAAFVQEADDPAKQAGRSPDLSNRASAVVLAFAVGEGGKATRSYRLSAPLTVHAARQVTVSMVAKDAGGGALPVDGILYVGEERIEGTGPVRRRLRPGTLVWAEASYATEAGPVRVETAKRHYSPMQDRASLELAATLPVYAPGGLKISGSFKAEGGSIVDGLVETSFADKVKVGAFGKFRFTNRQAMATGRAIQLLATVIDDEGRFWKPEAPVKAVVPAGGKLRLGRIAVRQAGLEVAGVQVRVTDWAGRDLPADRLTVQIGNRNAVWNGKLHVGDISIKRRGEAAKVVARLMLENGTTLTQQKPIPLRFAGPLQPKAPEAPLPLRFKIYGVSGLRFTGEIILDVPGDAAPPQAVSLLIEQGGPANPVTAKVAANESFAVMSTVPIRVLFPVRVIAEATVAGISYRGGTQAPAPARPAAEGATEVSLDRIHLTPTIVETEVPTLIGKTLAQARELLRASRLRLIEKAPGRPPSSRRLARTIYRQEPDPQARTDGPTKLAAGAAVTVWVYDRYRLIRVPDLQKLRLSDALSRLQELGFRVAKQPLGPAPIGRRPLVVVGQSPLPGAAAKPESQVTVRYYDRR